MRHSLGGGDTTNPIVRIDWEDIVQLTVKEGAAIKPAKCTTYGEWEHQDENSITIITERSDDDVTKQVFPIGCVKSITTLIERRE